ncbi:hypothetical protein GMRT_12523 [Giardia muris]|uniref:Uncharacterized protein n=1 Tax=Giardia muris TaxID=5742 RepID=A0A4Z1T7C1_GIAMU|nr:hypothetical protein GMRT_12523 [Giardia muris]|eukprot:TNJ28391.1 hypothetical protein GMRT_12523 [Giardia muris]
MASTRLRDLYTEEEDQRYFSISESSVPASAQSARISSNYNRCSTPKRSSSLSKSFNADDLPEGGSWRPVATPNPNAMRRYSTWRTATDSGTFTDGGSESRVQVKIRKIANPYAPVSGGSERSPDRAGSPRGPTTYAGPRNYQAPTYERYGGASSGQGARAKSPGDGLRRSKSRESSGYTLRTRNSNEITPRLPAINADARAKRQAEQMFTEPKIALPTASAYAKAGMTQADPHFASWKPRGVRASSQGAQPVRGSSLASLPVLNKPHQ